MVYMGIYIYGNIHIYMVIYIYMDHMDIIWSGGIPTPLKNDRVGPQKDRLLLSVDFNGRSHQDVSLDDVQR